MFIPIRKVDEAKRLVYGVAAQEVADRSDEIMDYATSAPNFKSWSAEMDKSSNGLSKGNIREMHGKTAAGKVASIDFNDGAKSIEIAAKVVDDQAWQKVIEGVYTGFSMGGSYEKRWTDPENPRLTRYTAQPQEISLVDRPCIPTATFDVFKADGMTEKRHFKSVLPEITNAELAAKAQELAKAVGGAYGDGQKPWSDFLEAARAELEKAQLAKLPPTGDTAFAAEAKANEPPRSVSPMEIAARAVEIATGEGDGTKWADYLGKAKDELMTGFQRQPKITESPSTTISPDSEIPGNKAAGSPVAGEEWEQVWLCKRDGSTFKKKDDLRAHVAKLDAEAAVAEKNGQMLAALDAVAGKLQIEVGKAVEATHSDYPTNSLTKKDFTPDERKMAAMTGHAMKDGSFPINNVDDLKNAVTAHGRAKDPEKAKAHIKTRARALGAMDELPADWKKDDADKVVPLADMKKALTETLTKYMGSEVYDASSAINALGQICDVMRSEMWEENAKNPAQIEMLRGAIDKLKSFIASEITENNDPSDPAYAMRLAAKIEGLAKRGARHSVTDMAMIQGAHDCLAKCGASCGGGGAMKADGGGLRQFAEHMGEDLVKMQAERDALQKTMDERVLPLLNEFMKRVEIIEKTPLPLPLQSLARSISKADDNVRGALTTVGNPLEELAKTAEGQETIRLALFKAAQQEPVKFGAQFVPAPRG